MRFGRPSYRCPAGQLASTWAILEGQITIVSGATSHENDRRDRRPLRVGRHESRELFSRSRLRRISAETRRSATKPGAEKRPARAVYPQRRVAGAVALVGCGADRGTIGALIAQTPDQRLVLRDVPPNLAAGHAGLQEGDEISA